MENWDLASKYAEISANAYGTAAEKMEAYTDSIEAAQNRVTVAVEGFAQQWNSSGLLKRFYNAMAYVIENLDKLAGAIGIVIAATQGGAILRGISGGLARGDNLAGRLSSFMNILQTPSDWKGSFKQAKNNFVTRVNEDYTETLIAQYNTALEKRTASLTAEDAQAAKTLQNDILRQNAQVRSLQTQYLLGDISEDEYKAKVQNTLAYKQATLALKEEMLSTENLKKAKDKNYAQIVAQNTKGFNQASQTTGMQAMRSGLFMLGGGAFGSFAGSTLAEEYLGEGAGIYGGMLGGLIGGAGGNSLNTFIGNLKQAKSEVSSLRDQLSFLESDAGFEEYGENVTNLSNKVKEQLSSAEAGASLWNPKNWIKMAGGPLGLASIGITIATTIWGAYRAKQEAEIKESQERFKELNDQFTESLNAQPDALKYDELVKGVDSLGRNVSLTDEEYSQFIETSNALAEIFPHLIVRTDEAGNSFLGLNGKVSEITSTIEEYTDSLQKATDVQLLDKNIFGEHIKDTDKQRKELEKEVSSLENDYAGEINRAGNPNLSEAARQTARENANRIQAELQLARKELANFDAEYEDYVDAILRQNSDLEENYNNLTDDQKTFFDAFKNSLDFSGMNTNEAIKYAKNSMSQMLKSIQSDDTFQEAIDLYYNLDPSIPAEQYEQARQEILSKILSVMDFLEFDESGRKEFLAKMGFTLEGGLITDDTNYLSTIFNEGLDSKLVDNVTRSYLAQTYSMEDLATAYEILKNSADHVIFTMEELQNAILGVQINESPITELATEYENLREVAAESLTSIQKNKMDLIEQELDSWSQQLGTVKGDYDDIIDKINVIGDLTYGGTSETSPEDVTSKAQDYMDFAEYLASDDFKGPQGWNPDQLAAMANYEELLPYISSNDISGLKQEIQKFLNDIDNLYQQSYQNIMYQNEEVTKQTLANKADEVARFKELYGVDLNNFTTLKEAETYLNAATATYLASDYETWVADMEKLYAEDLGNFSDAAAVKTVINANILKGMDSATRAEYSKALGEAQDALGQEWDNMSSEEKTDFNTEFTFDWQQSQITAESIQKAREDFQKIVDSTFTGGTTIPSVGSAGSGSGDEFTYDDYLDALESLIDKEWEAMQVFDEMTGKVTGETAYFAKMEDLLDKKIAYYKAQAASALAEGDQATYYDYQAKLIQAEVDLANLDDERLQDEIDLAEAKGYSLDVMIKLYQEYVKTADTEEDRVEYQNKLNDAIREEYEERKRIREFEQSFIETALDRQSGTAWSDSGTYESLINAQMESYVRDAEAAQAEITRLTQQWIGTYMEQGKSYDQAKELAGMTEDVQDATQDYLDAIEKQAELTITRVTDKLDEIEQRISDLEASKPQEWTSIDQIRDFSEQTIALLEAKIPEIKKGLEDVSMLTDEQIQELVDQLNDASTALMEAQINMREEIQSYQESQFSAVEWAVENIIDDLQDEIDKLDDAYEPILKDLEDANDERERAVELEDLLQQKLNASKEKERVYREGKNLSPHIKIG